MGNSYIHRKISYPIGFWHWKDVWMMAKAPGKNASSRSRGAHDENWSVNLLLHFSVFWEPRCHSAFAMISIQRWPVGASRSCLQSNGGDWGKRLSNLVGDSGEDSYSPLAPRTRS